MTAPNFPSDIEKDDTTEPAEDGEAAARGKLLDWPEEKAAKEARRLWDQHKWFHRCKAGESLQNKKWRGGQRFTKLVIDHDNGTVRLHTPMGLDALPPTPNKVEESVKNAIAILMSDPPRPECEPSGDTAQARDAAQCATRFLLSIATESGLNTDAVTHGALDIAATYSSGFAEVCYDPTAGGYVPLTIKARPSATTTDEALLGAPRPDGTTDNGPWVTKYVLPGNLLSDKAKGAQLTWQPG